MFTSKTKLEWQAGDAGEDDGHSAKGFYATPVPIHGVHGGLDYDPNKVVFLEVAFPTGVITTTGFGLDVYGTSMEVLRVLSCEETTAMLHSSQWIRIKDLASGLLWVRGYSECVLVENKAVDHHELPSEMATIVLSHTTSWCI